MAVHLHLHIIILLVWAIKASAIHCPTSCGNVSEIRYPFGIGEGCYFNEWFAVTCDNSSGSPVPFFSKTKLKLAEDISRRSNGMAIGLSAYVNISEGFNLSGTPFSFSHKLNKFISRGCNNYTTTFERYQIKSTNGCLPICACDPAKNHDCYDFMCTISSSHQFFPDISVPRNCKSAVMVEEDWLKTNYLANSNPNVLNESEHVPVVMEFGRYMGSCAEPYYYKSNKTLCNKDNFCLTQLDSSYFCVCSQPKGNRDEPGCTGNLFCNITSQNDCSNSTCPDGYAPNISHTVDGKPTCYQEKAFMAPLESPGKNKDISIGPAGFSFAILSSVIGTLSLSIGAQSLYNFVKRMIANKVKQIFFKKNGGSFLQQRMSPNDGNIEKPQFFTENELERATDSYNESRILGQGGQGTVYKGMLEEGRIIAVKRLKKVADRVDLFINEVEILFQIKHRNVVQFLGCCLDAELPLLAYEFIPSGTLFQYIHDQNQEFPLTWDLRLRIATEVANALSYLHSATSSARRDPRDIKSSNIHSATSPACIEVRDIKSSNILLDEKYRAKVSDVGTSRSIPVDVYSFGVVLAELLTGQEPIRSTDSEEAKDLAPYFLQELEQNRLFDILDARVSKDDGEHEIMTFANLTRRCLDSNGSERPTMRQVAAELAAIRTSNGASNPTQDPEEIDCVEIEITYEVEISSSRTELILESINSLCF
ncbi:hypothetical protein Pint_21777 [Pistacia integerrima]|uniref:Uncharacterized protein n=1 Tax=Pistacia integerrima TaxID=434235 RepID=A0ACC0XBR4_9ROSI|nr:hypothetical protein Pint_21777 [Pistacia integerrima]